MNFKNDLAEILKKRLTDLGISVDSNWDDYKVCLNYLELSKRWFDSSVTYIVVYSEELLSKLPTLTASEQQAIKDIEISLKQGKSITSYMSKQIRNTKMNKSDFFLKNWNIYHLHLEKLSTIRCRFNAPNLLFFQPQGRVVHFIDVRKHPVGSEWFVKDLIEIVYKNWPWLLKHLKGIKPTESISNDEVYSLTKRAVVALDFHGSALIPTNLGVSTSGHSTMLVQRTDYIFNNLARFELWLKNNENEVRKSIYNQTRRKTKEQLDYELIIENNLFYAYEKNTKSKIKLFECSL